MATGSLILNLIARTSQFTPGMRKAGKDMSFVQRQAQATSKAMSGFTKSLIAGTAASLGLAGGVNTLTTQLRDLNNLADRSRTLGVDPEDMQLVRFAAERNTISIQTLDMALQRYTRRTAEAAKGTGEAKGALTELRVDADRFLDLPLRQQMLGLADAFAAVPREADRVRLAMKLFDSEGVAMVKMLQDGSAALDDLFRRRGELGPIFDRSQLEDVQQANEAWADATTAFKAAVSQLVVEGAPLLKDLAGGLTATIQGATGDATGGLAIQKAVYDATLRAETDSLSRQERGQLPATDPQRRLAQLQQEEGVIRQQIADVQNSSVPFLRMVADERAAIRRGALDVNRQQQRAVAAQIPGSAEQFRLAEERLGFDRRNLEVLQRRQQELVGQFGVSESGQLQTFMNAPEFREFNANISSIEQLQKRIAELTQQFPILAETQAQTNRLVQPRPPVVPEPTPFTGQLDSAVSLLGGSVARASDLLTDGAEGLGMLGRDVAGMADSLSKNADELMREIEESREIRRRGRALTESLMTDDERRARETANALDLLRSGGIDLATFGRATADIDERFAPPEERRAPDIRFGGALQQGTAAAFSQALRNREAARGADERSDRKKIVKSSDETATAMGLIVRRLETTGRGALELFGG